MILSSEIETGAQASWPPCGTQFSERAPDELPVNPALVHSIRLKFAGGCS